MKRAASPGGESKGKGAGAGDGAVGPKPQAAAAAASKKKKATGPVTADEIALWDAVIAQNVAETARLLSLGASPNLWKHCEEVKGKKKKNPDGSYPSESRHSKVWKYVIARTCGSGSGTWEGGHFDNYLLGCEQQTPLLDHWTTLLMAASQLGSAEIVRLLIDHGANVHAQQPQINYGDGDGYGRHTALTLACRQGDKCLGAVQHLLAAGSKVDHVSIGDPGYEGIWYPAFTSLDFCVVYGAKDVARALVAARADVNRPAVLENAHHSDKQGPLVCYFMATVVSGDVAKVSELITSFRADVNWPNALINKPHYEDFGVGLRNDNVFKGLGGSPLLYAAERGDAAMVALLLSKGADPSQPEHIVYKAFMEEPEDPWAEDEELEAEEKAKQAVLEAEERVPGTDPDALQPGTPTRCARPLSVALRRLFPSSAAYAQFVWGLGDKGTSKGSGGGLLRAADIPSPQRDDPVVGLLLRAGATMHRMSRGTPFHKMVKMPE